MNPNASSRRRAFSALQFVILLAVAGIATGVILPALQRVREDANRLTCANNLRQLALAAQKFEATNGTLPPYWGAYPTQDALSIKGSWFCHLMPYVGQTALYGEVMADIQKTGTNWDVDLPADRRVATPASKPAEGTTGGKREKQEVARYNGHSHWEWRSTESREDGAGFDTEPATRAPAPARTGQSAGGVFRPQFCSATFSLLQCPSDPSPETYADAGRGQVYLSREQPWGSTNYVANWHALASSNPQSGFLTPPQKSAAIIDGLSNTVLLSEAYSWCDGKGRLALNSWDYHSFGLTWSLGRAIIDDGNGQRTVDFPRGMPNTYMFQVRPLPKETPDCPPGGDCCDNWRAQTGHVVLNAAMADGSVRELSSSISQRVWDHLLLPRDGVVPGLER